MKNKKWGESSFRRKKKKQYHLGNASEKYLIVLKYFYDSLYQIINSAACIDNYLIADLWSDVKCSHKVGTSQLNFTMSVADYSI